MKTTPEKNKSKIEFTFTMEINLNHIKVNLNLLLRVNIPTSWKGATSQKFITLIFATLSNFSN